MTRVALICLAVAIGLYVTGCAGTWDTAAHKDATLRTSLAATDVALLGVDMMQSRHMPDAYDMTLPRYYTEANPFLGTHPTKLAITAYCATWAAATIATRLWAPRWAQWAVLGAVGAIETETVWSNDREGLSASW